MSAITTKRYYSIRTGKRGIEINLVALRKIFFSIYADYSNKAYFDEYLSDYCPDRENLGKAGVVSNYILRKLRKDNLWPVYDHWEQYSEEDIFDLIEFLYDHISAPDEESATFHNFYNHYDYSKYDQDKGKKEFRNSINEILSDYSEGYELGGDGEIYALLGDEFHVLLEANIPAGSRKDIEIKKSKAINKFRKYGSTLDDRREAVRELADCLEYIRKDLKGVITKRDDGALFSIANEFGIRHCNDKQKTDYDKAVWLSWMFYFYLATLDAGLLFLSKEDRST